MVTSVPRSAVVGVLAICVCVIGGNRSALGSARVVGSSVKTIKPCQPAFFEIEIRRDGSTPDASLMDVALGLMERIVVNRRVYRQTTLGREPVNKAGLLLVDRRWLRSLPENPESIRIPLMLYFDIEDRAFLFEGSGRYDVSVGKELQLTVIVEQPTEEESVLIAAMKDMHIELMMWVMSRGEDRAPTVEARVAELLEAHPSTAYTEMLAVCLGHSMLPRFARGDGATIDEAFLPYRRSRMQVAERYFAPYCTAPFRTPFQSAAAYRFAHETLGLDRAWRPGGTDEQTRVRDGAIELLEAVRDSGYTGWYRWEALARLREMGR